MTKLITFTKLAAKARCAPVTIRRIVAKGKLEEGERNGRSRTVKVESVEAALAIIKAEAPKSGYSWRGKQKPASRKSSPLGRLASWLELSDTKRDLLMQLAEKYDEKDLLLLLSL